jgi:hypothetical protein
MVARPFGGNAMKKTILLAPHDDGFGAFSTMCSLARALQARAPKEIQLQLIFLTGRDETGIKKLAEDLKKDQDLVIVNPHLVTVKGGLLYEIARAPETGNVDPPRILEVLKRISVMAPDWDINWNECKAHGDGKCALTWDSIDLCISMGVPWLHRAARRHNKPSIELGDTCVSLILRGCLEEGGLLTPFANRILDDVAENELMAGEAWLLPFAAPPVYENHFALGGVPVNWLPGLFGTREPGAQQKAKDLRAEILKDPRFKDRHLVGVHSGKTTTWNAINSQLAALGGSSKCAYVTAGMGPELYPLAGGGSLPSASVRSTSLRAQHLCLTRGGISALEHIVACCPIAITEEPLHWLSHHQRAALVRGGLCIPISLDDLRRDPDQFCADLLDKRKGELEQIKRRMAGIQHGADEWFAGYVLQFLNA